MNTTLKQKLFCLLGLLIASSCSNPTEKQGRTLLPSDPNSGPLPPVSQEADPETLALIQAVQKTGAKSTEGKLAAKICEVARPHLDYMISQGEISHDGYNQRSKQLNEDGGTNSGEIVAYNCSSNMSVEKGAAACANSWLNSSGHWKLMKDRWDGYCYAMKRTGNCYYCIGLFSNGDW